MLCHKVNLKIEDSCVLIPELNNGIKIKLSLPRTINEQTNERI